VLVSAIANSFAWTPDGTRLVVVDGSQVMIFDGRTTLAVSAVPERFAHRIVGMTNDRVILCADDDLLVVPLDGSPSIRLTGVLAAVFH
jgi:uncharacterized protein with WD repeat